MASGPAGSRPFDFLTPVGHDPLDEVRFHSGTGHLYVCDQVPRGPFFDIKNRRVVLNPRWKCSKQGTGFGLSPMLSGTGAY